MTTKSKAWKTVTSAKIPGFRDPAQSEAYAESLHDLLDTAGIENRIVTFTIADGYGLAQSQTRARQQVRSAVVYRNEKSPEHPWWLMDNMHSAPVWLPDEPMVQQVQFAEQDSGMIVVAINTPEELPAVAEAPTAVDWEQQFQRMHGTSFDPHSSVDRKKMAALKAEFEAKATKLKAKRGDSSKPQHAGRSAAKATTKSPAKLDRSLTPNPTLNPASVPAPKSTKPPQQAPDMEPETKCRTSARATVASVMPSGNSSTTITVPNGSKPEAYERAHKGAHIRQSS